MNNCNVSTKREMKLGQDIREKVKDFLITSVDRHHIAAVTIRPD
jgi:hypothetical protein